MASVKCSECEGTGEDMCLDCGGFGHNPYSGETCKKCNGARKVKCTNCNGTGYVETSSPAAPASAALTAQELRKQGHDAEKRKDYAQAFRCWTEAAEMGDADSCFQMGFKYMFRYDYPEFTRAKDYDKAEEWFNKAIAAAGSDKDTLKAAKQMLKEVNKAQGKSGGLFGKK